MAGLRYIVPVLAPLAQAVVDTYRERLQFEVQFESESHSKIEVAKWQNA